MKSLKIENQNTRRFDLVPLKDQSGRREKNKFLVCDIETSKWTKFLIIGLYDGENYYDFTSLSKFFAFIFSKYNNIDCFAHFGGRFDFLFLLSELLKSKKYGIGPMVPRGSGILCIDVLSGNNRISLRDSSAFLPFSLRSLTENFGVEHKKQEIDYEKITNVTPKLREYLEHDCRGLHECIEKYHNWPLIQKSGPAATIAGQALRIFRTYLKVPIQSLNKKFDEEIRPAYFGGRVEIFKPYYKGEKPLYCYDVNSLYPTMLKNHDYPVGFKYSTYEYEKNSLGFYEAEVYVPETMKIPPLGILHDKKYVFATGHFKGLFTIQEINYARSLGCKIKTGIGHIFYNGGKIFKDFITDLYEIKKNAKSNSVDYVLAKLLMNSSYGRFGIRRDRENLVFDDGSIGLDPVIDLKVGRHNYRLAKKEIELETFSNVAISAYVTSYARIHMHKIYLECGDELYYTDTDSIFTTKKFKTSNELGDLKLEYQCNSACFLLPKTYRAGEKIVMKGFDKKKIKHFEVDDFYAALEGDLKRLKIIQEPKFATFKTAVRKGKIVTMTERSTREIRSKYDKRIFFKKENGEYDSRPLFIEPTI